MKLKIIFTYLLYLLPWFLSTLLFKIDNNYYLSLRLPSFAPSPITFAIVWPILYILISISIFNVFKKSNKYYKINLLINYILNQLYTYFFFVIKSNSLALIDTIIVLITSIILYIQTKKIDNKYSIFIIFYIIWNIFATILSIYINILN